MSAAPNVQYEALKTEWCKDRVVQGAVNNKERRMTGGAPVEEEAVTARTEKFEEPSSTGGQQPG